jgi:polynucleotide 5'-kinase involved in rRNA processing
MLLPTLAEIFRTADKVRVIGNTMINMQNTLIFAKDRIENNLEAIESNRFQTIITHMSQAQRAANEMHSVRKDTIHKDDGFVSSILTNLRAQQEYTKTV